MKDYKILFITGLFPQKRNPVSGIFVTRRMLKLTGKGINYKIYYFNLIETGFYKIYKKIFSLPYNDENKISEFLGIKYTPVNLTCNLFDKIYPAKRSISLMTHNLKEKIKDEKFDLIHAHWVYPEGFVAIVLKKELGIPCVISAHGSDINRFPHMYPGRKASTLFVLNNADIIFFTNKSLLYAAQKLGFKGRNYEIMPTVGVDTALFYQMDKIGVKKQLKLPLNNVKIVGFIGNFYKEKRADSLPNIFHIVAKEYPDVKFLLIGGGRLKNRVVKKCLKKGLNIDMIGRVAPETMPLWMNTLDVLVLPSRSEGMPNVLMEAQACGCPVIGSDVGGIPEAIGYGGVVIKSDPNFEKRFANAIIEILLHPPDRKRIRESIMHLNTDGIIERQIKIYEELIKNE